MLTPRDGYSFGDFQYEGEKIIAQRKRVPITSRKLTSGEVEDLFNAFWHSYCKYYLFKSELSPVFYVAEHPCGSFYHAGNVSFGTGVNVTGGGLLCNVSMHQTTISTEQKTDAWIPYCIFDSEIGSSMLSLGPRSVIISSEVSCSTILNGSNLIRYTSLSLTTLKGNNFLLRSDVENFLISDSRISDVTLKGFGEPLVIANAEIQDKEDVFPVCKYNIKTEEKDGGLLYRTNTGAVAFTTPEYGARILEHEHAIEEVTFYIEKLYGKSKKRNDLVTEAQNFVSRVFSESQ